MDTDNTDKEIDNFDVLKKMGEQNRDIRSFPLGNNFISANTGKNGWGRMTIAVNNNTIMDMMGDGFDGVLIIYQRKQFDEVKNELSNSD